MGRVVLAEALVAVAEDGVRKGGGAVDARVRADGGGERRLQLEHCAFVHRLQQLLPLAHHLLERERQQVEREARLDHLPTGGVNRRREQTA